MDKTLPDELSERLERLERECQGLRREMRWWRRAGVTAPLIGILLVVIGGAQNPPPRRRTPAAYRKRAVACN